ncbi:type III-B CRISPR module-associated protein Cmr3 [Bacillus pumilus]|uniref:type III-B CRISPR module-associated protein Cmr3 n=1 Tax=Bacillus pumilus TaxID=1408 RepID=UPI0028141627|nr:type III-B CRISPR module-associated protein Cmr3 [Bacillus pumilus]MDR0123015.1 type III-B CRISPR module-associated protein Cmr3 [Bacillus pumilus]
MPERWFHIQPLDPLLIRDARPFQSVPGIRARSLNDVPPSVVAGTLRTALAKTRQSMKHTTPLSYYAKSLVRGPLYRWHDHLYVPMPNDLELFDDEYGMYQVRPKRMMSKGQGFFGTGKTGRFSEALWPPIGAGARKKMKSPPAFVSLKWMMNWLTDAVDESQVKEALTEYQHMQKENHSFKNDAPPAFIPALQRQERTQIEVETGSKRAKDQHLFSTESLLFPDDFKLEAGIDLSTEESEELKPFSGIHPIGGERRLAHIEDRPHVYQQNWTCPDAIKESLKNKPYVRMILATPAYFSKGWQPGWLDEQLMSKPLFDTNVRLKLVWASVPYWQPISGWSLANKDKGREKAIRRLVPAGSVYFFTVEEGDPAELAEKMWLQSVSDRNRRKEAFDREDGCGLALWGTWKPNE